MVRNCPQFLKEGGVVLFQVPEKHLLCFRMRLAEIATSESIQITQYHTKPLYIQHWWCMRLGMRREVEQEFIE
jgi:hypothetical protein